jgi:hypothetical protein
MKNNNCLIVTIGYFGDIAFASSIAKKLKIENQFERVDYLIGFPQMQALMNNNPYIDEVYVSDFPNSIPSKNIDFLKYDKVVRLSPLSFEIPPPIEFQISAGVNNPDSEYEIYTNSEYDEIAKTAIEDLRSNGKKVIAVMANWEPKTYIFTEDQYKSGIDVPNLGYGGKHRNIEYINSELEKEYNVIYIGYPQEYNQIATSKLEDNHQKSILFECSLMKFCDAFVGTEGGLCNLAAGVGTKTIITGDFVHQLYGWNGVLKKIKEPKLGPIHYFLNSNHVELNSYISDEEVIKQIIKNIK